MSAAKRAERQFRESVLNWTAKILVFIEAYADETGTHDATGRSQGAEVAGVCGYMAWADDWAKFSGEWQSVLDRNGVKRFHFAEYADKINGPRKPDWPYLGWSDEKREIFIHDLAAIAGRRPLCGVALLVSVRDYNKVMPADVKTHYAHPYYWCLQGFIEGLLEHAKSKFMLPHSECAKIAVFLDKTTFPHDTARLVLEHLQETADPDNRLSGELTYTDSRVKLPLQAADLLAYRARQIVYNRIHRGQRIEPGRLERELGGKKIMAKYYTTQTLRELLNRNRSSRIRRVQ